VLGKPGRARSGPAAYLRDLSKKGAVCLSVLRANLSRQMRFFYYDKASYVKDTPGLLKLRRVQELLFTVASNKDLNLIPVLTLPEK
jgi:hypothetical protein